MLLRHSRPARERRSDGAAAPGTGDQSASKSPLVITSALGAAKAQVVVADVGREPGRYARVVSGSEFEYGSSPEWWAPDQPLLGSPAMNKGW